MQVAEILRAKGDRVVEVEPDAEVRSIADTLRQENIGAALVRDRDGTVLGIVSERDIVRRIADEGPDALTRSAADLMSRTIITCQPDSSTEELIEQMLGNNIRHLPVYQDDRLAGIVSIGDVVKGVHAELKWREQVLRQQIVTAVGWSTDED